MIKWDIIHNIHLAQYLNMESTQQIAVISQEISTGVSKFLRPWNGDFSVFLCNSEFLLEDCEKLKGPQKFREQMNFHKKKIILTCHDSELESYDGLYRILSLTSYTLKRIMCSWLKMLGCWTTGWRVILGKRSFKH